MAWSIAARRRPPLPGCTRHKNCANCSRYALTWRRELLAGLATGATTRHIQPALFTDPVAAA
jgi:hypothetical protein